MQRFRYEGESTDTINGDKTMQRPQTQNEEQKKRGNHPSILSRWQNDEIWRASHLAIGWPETYVKYLDYITTVDIKHDAPHRQRYRYENRIFMRSDDPKLQAGPLWKREDDYKTSTVALMCLQQEQGKVVPHIPIQVRTRQHNTLDPTIQQNLEWLSENWQTYFSTPTSSSSSSWSQNSTWWNSKHWENSQQWREWQPEEGQDQKWWEKW